MDNHREMVAGIIEGLKVRCCSDESERLKDLSPNDARDAFTYGKIAGYLARSEDATAGPADISRAWERVAIAKAEYRQAQIQSLRDRIAEAHREIEFCEAQLARYEAA